MNGVKIKILVDNCTAQSDVLAEHGFSMLIEEGETRILFDTGASDVLLHNAKVYNLDLATIGAVVLSHGHIDHSGGLRKLLEHNSFCSVICGEGFDVKRVGTRGKEISFPKECTVQKDRLKIVSDVEQISESVYVVSAKKSKINSYSHISGFYKFDFADRKENDNFDDELFIVVKRDEGIVVCSGCAHRGIPNIIELAQEVFNENVIAIVGGLHTVNDSDRQIAELCGRLETENLKKIICCHCTGVNSFAKIARHLSMVEVSYATVGNNIVL